MMRSQLRQSARPVHQLSMSMRNPRLGRRALVRSLLVAGAIGVVANLALFAAVPTRQLAAFALSVSRTEAATC